MGAVLFGIQQLNQALAVYETSVAQSYAQGLRSLSGSRPQTTGWRQGGGMDREPSKLLDEAAELIARASADTASQAAQRASQATTVSLIVMLAVCAASVVGALLFSRSVVRTNADSVAGDPAKRRPGRRKRCCGRQPQATGAATGWCGGVLPPVCAGVGLSRPRSSQSVTGCGLGPRGDACTARPAGLFKGSRPAAHHARTPHGRAPR